MQGSLTRGRHVARQECLCGPHSSPNCKSVKISIEQIRIFVVYGNSCGPQSHFFLNLRPGKHLCLVMRPSSGFEFESSRLCLEHIRFYLIECKSGLVVSGLDSRSKGCGFESCLVLSKILDGNGLKAMPGLITIPNSGSFMEK